jgi:hypothetical protein
MASSNLPGLTDATSIADADTIYLQQGGADREAAMSLVKAFALATPVTVVGNATAGSQIRLVEDTDNGSNYVALKAPDTLGGNLTLTLPSVDGSSGHFLQTNGSGTLSFAAGTSLATPLAVVGNATAGAEIRLPEDTDNGSNYVAIKAPDNLAATYTLTLPANDGDASQYLQTDGSGTLSWATVSGASAPLTLASGTITDPSTALTITQTWNDAADTFTAFNMNITATAHASASRVFQLQTAGTTKLSIDKDGRVAVGSSDQSCGFGMYFGGEPLLELFGGGSGSNAKMLIGGGSFPYARLPNDGSIGWSNLSNPRDSAADCGFFRAGAAIISVRGSSSTVGGALNFLEQTAPSAPSTNQVVIYAEDNGSSKTRLMARFATGAAQQIAIEP